MYMELHDTEVGRTHVATIRGIDAMYQAEMWLDETYRDPRAKGVVRWVLFNGTQKVAEWERPEGSDVYPRRK